MKCLSTVLFAFTFVMSARATADLVVSNNAVACWFGDSYDYDDDSAGSNNIVGFQSEAYFYSYLVLNNPASNIQFYNFSRSGGLLNDEILNAASKGIVVWGYQWNRNQHLGFGIGTENGSLNSNQMYLAMSNLFQAPVVITNGSIMTNQPGWCSSNLVQWIGVGDTPLDANDGGVSTHMVQNDGATNCGLTLGVRGIDLWHTNLNSWTNDWISQGGTNVGWIFKPAAHLGKGGQLNRALTLIKGITTNFDVSTCTLDWNSASPSATNHCVVSSISKSGSVLTFNRLDDRLPMAWDVPDGTITNDCRNAFNLIASDGNLFRFTLQITNAPTGNYTIQIDGVTVATLTDSQLSNGWNMFTNYVGPYWNQRKEVLGRIRDLEYVNRVTLKPGSAGDGQGLVSLMSNIAGQWNAGLRGDALISDTTLSNKVAQVQTNFTAIHAAAQPTNHTFIISNTTPVVIARYGGHR